MLFATNDVLKWIFLLIFVVLAIKAMEYISMMRKINKIPGRETKFIIGNFWDFIGSSEHMFQEMRRYISEFSSYGSCKGWMFFIPIVAIYEPEDAEKILGNPIHNKKGFFYSLFTPWLGEGLLTSSGEKWQSRRKMLTPTLHFNILQKFLRVFNSESKKYVENLEMNQDDEIDVVPGISKYTLNSICETAMGTSLGDTEESRVYRQAVNKMGMISIKKFTHAWMMIDFFFRFTKLYWEQKTSLKVLHDFSTKVINKRKTELSSESNGINTKRKQFALLDLMIVAQNQGEDIDDEGIRNEVDTFMFEGYDTTSISLSFTMLLLANNQKIQEDVYNEIKTVTGLNDELSYEELKDLKYLERCIKESLRLFPSVPLVARTTGEDVYLKNGGICPKGCTCVIFIYDLHRRADLYPDPETFNPDRFLTEECIQRHPYAYIPFSAGSRNCIGQKFAMLEMKCMLVKVLRKYILEPIDTPKTTKFILDFVLRNDKPVKMKLIPRSGENV